MDQISEILPLLICFTTSGAIQLTVPQSDYYLLDPHFYALPKSANLQIPLESTRILPPLISLCAIPWACKYSRPYKI